MFKNKFKKQIEEQIVELKLYLENNYKDLAIGAKKEAINLLENYYETGKLNEKAYRKYKAVLDEYTEQMKEYNHQQFYRS